MEVGEVRCALGPVTMRRVVCVWKRDWLIDKGRHLSVWYRVGEKEVQIHRILVFLTRSDSLCCEVEQ